MASGKTHRLVNVTAMIVPESLAAAYFLGEHSVSQWQSIGALAGGYFLSTAGVHPTRISRHARSRSAVACGADSCTNGASPMAGCSSIEESVTSTSSAR